MKFLILALAAMGLFSCTSGKNVAENKTQQRTIASLQELGLSDAQTNGLSREIENYQARSAQKVDLADKVKAGALRAKSFIAAANSTYFSDTQKRIILNEDIAFASNELEGQTGGSGYLYEFFAGDIDQLKSLVAAGQFSEAAKKVSVKQSAVLRTLGN